MVYHFVDFGQIEESVRHITMYRYDAHNLRNILYRVCKQYFDHQSLSDHQYQRILVNNSIRLVRLGKVVFRLSSVVKSE